MNDATCTDSLWPDTCVTMYPEHESGFLLPQLMGALASESAGPVSNGLCRRRSNGTVLAKAGAFVMRVLIHRASWRM